MSWIPTGFPELDKLIGGGLPRPYCLCLSGENTTSIYPFVFHITHNFLKEGLRGLYVCFDWDADEIKMYAKGLGEDIGRYEENYNIFFLDFFKESQMALIDSAKIGVLTYEPNGVLKAIGEFLDWIKNGFLIVDSISTLALNMDAKNAYELIRAFKLLTRPFNLLVIGIAYTSPLDPKVFNTLCSVADGHISFEKETIRIEYLVGTSISNDVFTLSRNLQGKLILKPILSKGVNRKIVTQIFDLLSKHKTLKITPQLSLNSDPKNEVHIGDLTETLEKLREDGLVSSKPYCSSLVCPYCNSYEVNIFLKCPECESVLLEKGEAIEHLHCGHIDFKTTFEKGPSLICPKCKKELRQIGVDYRKVGIWFRCSQRHIFSAPLTQFSCPNCNKIFNLDEAHIKSQFVYELTEKGEKELKKLKE